MKLYILNFIISILTFSSIILSADEKKIITIAGDIWPPMSCSSHSKNKGLMVDITERIFSDAGYKVIYKTMPWARCIREAEEGTVNAIIGAHHNDAPDFIFPKTAIMRISANSFFVLKENPWRFNGLKSLDEVRVGATIGYDYNDEALNNYLKKNKKKNVFLLAGEETMPMHIRKLISRRVDVIIAASPVFFNFLKELKIKDQFTFAGRMTEPQNCYIAFSPNIKLNSQKLTKIFDKGFKALEKQGIIKEAFSKYGLNYNKYKSE